MSSYMDMEDFMDVLDYAPNYSEIPKPNYDVLLQSITNLGTTIDGGHNKELEASSPENLTASIFSTMSDNDLLSHFMPVRGIDYDQNYGNIDIDIVKAEKCKEEGMAKVLSADTFLPHRVVPQLNPLYKLSSAFKIVKPNNAKKMSPSKIDKEKEEEFEEEFAEEEEEQEEEEEKGKIKNINIEANEQQIPRQLKKRKPRTYKYNPKPLQHKEMRSFVPNDLKDLEYWHRRKRNNEAAKKSREERRKKELEILKSYEIMKNEHSQTKIENIRLKTRNTMLEKQVLELKKKICQRSK